MSQTVTSIGNATIIVHDQTPVLTTDPWIGDEDPAYFGSWILSHEIPSNVKNQIYESKYIWYSHGHPDHMNPTSLKRFKKNRILLPDHKGSRIFNDLQELGYDVSILPDRKWVTLTDNIKIQCITTLIQDSVLLIDVCGKLFINLNDAGAKGCSRYIKNLSKNYKKSFLLALSGYGDADMINLFEEDGTQIEPYASKKYPVGQQLTLIANRVGANSVIPSSSFHQYQREDSLWAQEYTTPHDIFNHELSTDIEYFEPFTTIDCNTLDVENLNPKKIIVEPKNPIIYGDNYSDELDKNDIKKIKEYFSRKDFINDYFGFLNFRVGGKDNFIYMNKNSSKGVTFEAPRGSLMTSINYRIFDDLLIGNFMKTTLHNCSSLYEGIGYNNFNFNVAKFADNGLAETKEEVKEYLREYKRRSGYEYFLNMFEDKSKSFLVRLIPRNSYGFALIKKIYTKYS